MHLTTPDQPRVLQSKGDVPQTGADPSARSPRADSDTLASHTHDRRKNSAKLRRPLLAFFAAACVSVLIVWLRSGDSSVDGKEPAESSMAVQGSTAPQSAAASASVSDRSRASEPGATEHGASKSRAAESGAWESPKSPPEAKATSSPSPSTEVSVAPSAPKRASAPSTSRPTGSTLSSAQQTPAPTSTRALVPASKEKPRFDLGI